MPTLPDLLNPGYQPPPGAVRNEWGYYVMPDGSLAPGQQTPGSQNFTPVDASGGAVLNNIPEQYRDPNWAYSIGGDPATQAVPGAPGLYMRSPSGGDSVAGNDNTGGGGVGDGGGFGGGYSSAGFQFPQFHAPAWQGVSPFTAPAPFSYKDFTAPTIEEARNEPGFAFALQEGQKALQNSAAAKGTLRSGGAEKGLAAWTNQFADQNYGNVFNRAADIYGMNRGNAAQNYLTNYNISRDVWDRNAQQQNLANNYNFNAAAAEFNPQFQASQLQFADLFNRQALNQNTLADLARYGYQ